MVEFTRGIRDRKWLLLAAVVSLVAAALTVLPIGFGRAAEVVEEDAGVLLVHVESGGDSRVRYYPDADADLGTLGALGAEQSIDISNKCGVATDGSLLVLTEAGGTRGVGAVSNGLGVRTKNNCSSAQGRVNTAQTLSFALGSSTAFPADVRIKTVEVDVEGKFDADLAYVLDGTTAGTADLANTSDNGPDAGAGDNNLVTIAPTSVFTAISFAPDGVGEVAIEGGGDGLVAGGTLRTAFGVNETLFELVTVTEFDGIVACGDDVSTGDGVTAPEATFTRGDDNILGKPGGGLCNTLIGFNLSSSANGTQTITFEFEEEELPSWFGEFTWVPETAVVPVPATDIDEDGDGVFEGDLVWCDGFSGNIDPETNLPIPNLPAGSEWCLTGQQTALVSSGLMQVTQQVYGLTDPQWSR